eukprot:gene7370-8152_t
MNWSETYVEELSFFQSYHRNKVNIWIHAISIPFEWLGWTLLVSLFPPWHWLFSTVTAVLVLLSNSHTAYPTACFHLLTAWITGQLRGSMSMMGVFCLSVALQVVAWTVQVVFGHYLLEGNSPAMVHKLTLVSVFWSTAMAWDALLGEKSARKPNKH